MESSNYKFNTGMLQYQNNYNDDEIINSECKILAVSTELPQTFQKLFSFNFFNYIQSKTFDSVYHSDSNIVVGSPSGSGKTVLFELAILNLLNKIKNDENEFNFQKRIIIYLAPLKALVQEKFYVWSQKFQSIGIKCMELTGDSDSDSFFNLPLYDIILTTPEKWDSICCRWREHQDLMDSLSLVLIDEVHLLNEQRGACLEGLISRIKAMKRVKLNMGFNVPATSVRFLALSATIPNIEDIASWLDAKYFNFGDNHRPVPLNMYVRGFQSSSNPYLFDVSLNWKLSSIIKEFANEKPFCSTKKGCSAACQTLIKDFNQNVIIGNFLIKTQEHKIKLLHYSSRLKDRQLQDLVKNGIAVHHAGLGYDDRKIIEYMFIEGDLSVLVSTSTLAQGVNLPAHLVIIKGTHLYDKSRCKFINLPKSSLLQMIGRAGRPQFDSNGIAVIMTEIENIEYIQNNLLGKETVESNLLDNMIQHINAEIILGTMNDIATAVEWLRSTFLFHRIKNNPKLYLKQDRDITDAELDDFLKQKLLFEIGRLVDQGLIETDGYSYFPKLPGILMTKHYLKFETMCEIIKLTKIVSLESMLRKISNMAEFNDFSIRQGEKKILNDLNKKNKIKFIIKSNEYSENSSKISSRAVIKTTGDKIFILIQAALSHQKIDNRNLTQDISQIFHSALRIQFAATAYLQEQKLFQPIQNSIYLLRSFINRMWNDSPYITLQLEGLGINSAKRFFSANIKSVKELEQLSTVKISMILDKKGQKAADIQAKFAVFPHYSIDVSQIGYNNTGVILKINVRQEKSGFRFNTNEKVHICYILVNYAGRLLMCKKIKIYEGATSIGNFQTIVSYPTSQQGQTSITINVFDGKLIGVDKSLKYSPKFPISDNTNVPKFNINVDQNNTSNMIKYDKNINLEPIENTGEIEKEYSISLKNLKNSDKKNKKDPDLIDDILPNVFTNAKQSSSKYSSLKRKANQSRFLSPHYYQQKIDQFKIYKNQTIPNITRLQIPEHKKISKFLKTDENRFTIYKTNESMNSDSINQNREYNPINIDKSSNNNEYSINKQYNPINIDKSSNNNEYSINQNESIPNSNSFSNFKEKIKIANDYNSIFDDIF